MAISTRYAIGERAGAHIWPVKSYSAGLSGDRTTPTWRPLAMTPSREDMLLAPKTDPLTEVVHVVLLKELSTGVLLAERAQDAAILQ